MTRLKRATIALPLIVVLLGVVVPVLMDRREDVRASDAQTVARRVDGRTAGEWAELASVELERGRVKRALAAIKTAESLEPGKQYTAETAEVRRALRRASEVRELRSRFVTGSVDHLDLAADGAVVSGHRLVTVLPGESLWTIAGEFVAAELGVPTDEVTEPERYAAWDVLTSINGVRELEVGERVRVPVPEPQLLAMEAANRRDLELVAAARTALGSGDLDEAARLRSELTTAFAETTVSCSSLDDALSSAVEERDAMLALERERELMEDVREALARAGGMPRSSRHRERLAALTAASEALREAEELREGTQYGDAAELLGRSLADERRFVVREDGSLLAVKAPGESYTQAAREAIEWMLERELAWSGKVHPDSSEKSSDERAWARYLIAAAEACGSDARFAALLDAVEEERELALPDPVAYFADRDTAAR